MRPAEAARKRASLIIYPSYPNIYDEAEAKRLHVEARHLYHKQMAAAETLFRADLETEYRTNFWGVATRDKLWALAWADGHASGYEEIENRYASLVDLARVVREDVY